MKNPQEIRIAGCTWTVKYEENRVTFLVQPHIQVRLSILHNAFQSINDMAKIGLTDVQMHQLKFSFFDFLIHNADTVKWLMENEQSKIFSAQCEGAKAKDYSPGPIVAKVGDTDSDTVTLTLYDFYNLQRRANANTSGIAPSRDCDELP